jgi:branched-chain amino acid transport system substrate-binding protein
VFNFRASYAEETAGLVKNFVEHGRTKIAVFYQIDAYGRSGWDGVRKALADEKLHGHKGLHMTGEATYRRGAKFADSMKEQVHILRGDDPAQAPDAVICVGAYAACAAFIRDARDAGLDVPIANISFVGSESMLALLQLVGAARGVDYTRDLVNSQVVPSYHDATLPAIRDYLDFTRRYPPALPEWMAKEDYPRPTQCFVGLEGFLNAKLLVAILDNMGPPFERSRLKKAAEAIDGFDLGIGVPVSFRAERHQAIDRVYYTEVRDGRFKTLTDWERWRR